MNKYILILACIFTFSACKKEESDLPTNINVDRQAVIDNYNNTFLPTNLSSSSWTGNVSACLPGTLSQTTLDKTLARINYYRKICGLSACLLDSSLNTKSQQGALMSSANSDIDHNPPTSWNCYTTEGANACGKSNLAIGGLPHEMVDLWMDDSGVSSLGHRRWILYSNAKTYGFGATNNAALLYALHNFQNPDATNLPEYIAFPPKGYFMKEHLYDYWSFAIPGGDFSNATVSMKKSGTTIATNKFALNNGYGDNTLVWAPSIGTFTADTPFEVTISNVVVNGQTKNYIYTTTVVVK